LSCNKAFTSLNERASQRDMTNNTSHIEVILLAIFPILDEIEAEIPSNKRYRADGCRGAKACSARK
jgi:hypothetical protein